MKNIKKLWSLAFGMALVGLLASCASNDTGTMVIVLADRQVASTATQYRVRVVPGSDDAGDVFTRTNIPRRVLVTPRGGDATRTFLVVAEALLNDRVIARRVVSSGFAAGTVRQLVVIVEGCSAIDRCAEGESCSGALCTAPEVRPGDTLPIYTVDYLDSSVGEAGMLEASVVDAARDGTVSDARVDGGPSGEGGPAADACAAVLAFDCDGDGHGGSTTAVCPQLDSVPPDASTCAATARWVALADDCDDAAATAFPGSPEVCDGIDNDCNDAVDDTASGCSCTAGQTTACGFRRLGRDSCEAVSVNCEGGAFMCPAGLVMGTEPEVCDDVDDDCDGMVDETLGAPVMCRVDADGDTYPAATGTVRGCGSCPAGSVPMETTQPDDCDDSTATFFAVQSVRADADGDGACVGAPTSACSGTVAPTGMRLASTCAADEDCDDASAALRLAISVRADTDSDTYCAGAAMTVCTDGTVPFGRRAAAACAGEDCNDASGATWRTATVRTDADADAYCTGSSSTICYGTSVPSGQRLAATCVGEDQCDGNGAAWNSATVRTDADVDGRCVGGVSTICYGSALPSGTRLASACVGEDACDTNGAAWVNVTVRYDRDADGLCSGTAFTSCTNGANPSGTRSVASCSAYEDCNDGTSAPCYWYSSYVPSESQCCTVGCPGPIVARDTFTCPAGMRPSSCQHERTSWQQGHISQTLSGNTCISTQTCNGFDAYIGQFRMVCQAP